MLLLSFWPFNRVSNSDILNALNNWRAEVGVPPLKEDNELSKMCYQLDVYTSPLINDRQVLRDSLLAHQVFDTQYLLKRVSIRTLKKMRSEASYLGQDFVSFIEDPYTNMVSIAISKDRYVAWVLFRKKFVYDDKLRPGLSYIERTSYGQKNTMDTVGSRIMGLIFKTTFSAANFTISDGANGQDYCEGKADPSKFSWNYYENESSHFINFLKNTDFILKFKGEVVYNRHIKIE